MERIWKEAVVVLSRYSPGMCLEGLMKTMKSLTVRSAGVAAGIRTERLPIRSRHTQRDLQASLFPSDQWKGHLWKLKLQMRVV
jgi:hypothetical protein